MSRLSTRARILLAAFTPLLVFFLIGASAAGYVLPRVIQGLVLQRQTALVQIAATGVASEMQGHLRLLLSTADEISFVVTETPERDAIAVEQVLARRREALGIFTGGIGYMDLDGTLLATDLVAEASIGSSFAHRAYFQQALTQRAPVFSSVFASEPSGADAVVAAVPVRQRGETVGVLVGEFDLQLNTWASNLNLLRTPQGGIASLIDAESRVIYHPDAELVGASIQADSPAVWKLVLAGEPDSRILRSQAGRQVIAYAPVAGIAWGVILEEPWETIMADARSSLWAIGGLWTAGLLVTALVLSWSVRRTMAPLDTVVAGARDVAGGGAFQPFPEIGPSDIRTLVDALNRMVVQLNAQQAALRDYARRVLKSQEEERKRISRDLHDETVQSLVGLNQRLELLRRAMDGGTGALHGEAGRVAVDEVASGAGGGIPGCRDAMHLAWERLEAVRTLASETLADVRRMSYNLRPFMLEDLGLAAALEALSRDLDQQLADTDVHCEIVGTERRLPAELELTTFRIVQEALNNVRKHTVGDSEAPSASRVSVALIYEPWGILALVEDNGPGMTMSAPDALVRDGHLGIAGMIERAQLFGGRLDIVSAPGEGTTVRLLLQG